jgi:hypothetical protein
MGALSNFSYCDTGGAGDEKLLGGLPKMKKSLSEGASSKRLF